MSISHKAPVDCRTTSPIVETDCTSSLDLYVDLEIKPSSLTVFSELGLDLYVDLSTKDRFHIIPGGGEFLPKSYEQSSDLGVVDEDRDHEQEDLDQLPRRNAEAAHPSRIITENAAHVLVYDKLTTSRSVPSAYTLTSPIETEVDNGTREVTDVDNVDAISLQNVQPGGGHSASPVPRKSSDLQLFQPPASTTTGPPQDTLNWDAVDGTLVATTEMDAWDDSEMVAIHGLTELKDELRFEQEYRSNNSGEVQISNSTGIAPSTSFNGIRSQELSTFAKDEFYQLRLHLEYLSKRVRICQASLQQMILDSDISSAEASEAIMYNDERKYKLKRGKLLRPRIHYKYKCMRRPLQRAIRSTRV